MGVRNVATFTQITRKLSFFIISSTFVIYRVFLIMSIANVIIGMYKLRNLVSGELHLIK